MKLLSNNFQHSNFDKVSMTSSTRSPYLRSTVLNKRGSIEKEAQQMALNVLNSHQERLQNNIFYQLRMRNMGDKEKRKLDGIINAEKQKIVLNPNHEYFSSSHLDVMANRLNAVKRLSAYKEQIEGLKIRTSHLKPYEQRVKYHLNSHFANQYQDVSYRVFNLMMQEDENLRHKHQDQPYEAATSSLLDIYESHSTPKNRLRVEHLKLATRRTDLIMTSTLSISIIPRREQHESEASAQIMVNVFPPLESDFSKSDIEEEKQGTS